MFKQTVICFTRVTSTFQLCAATGFKFFFSPVGFGRAPLFRRYTTAINKFVRSSDAFVPFSKILQANWSINILPKIHHKPAGRTRGVPKLFLTRRAKTETSRVTPLSFTHYSVFGGLGEYCHICEQSITKTFVAPEEAACNLINCLQWWLRCIVGNVGIRFWIERRIVEWRTGDSSGATVSILIIRCYCPEWVKQGC